MLQLFMSFWAWTDIESTSALHTTRVIAVFFIVILFCANKWW